MVPAEPGIGLVSGYWSRTSVEDSSLMVSSSTLIWSASGVGFSGPTGPSEVGSFAFGEGRVVLLEPSILKWKIKFDGETWLVGIWVQ